MTRRSNRFTGEAGLFRGCCLGLVLVLALIAAAAYFGDRALAGPSLGAAPAGPDDGESQLQIAIALGAHAVTGLIVAPHATVTISEHDLTVLAQAHNRHPDQYTNLQARVRDKLLVISANTHAGPFNVTPVLHIAPILQGSNAVSIALQVRQLDVGQLTLPGFVRDHFLGDLPSVVSISALFGAAPALDALSNSIECLAVTAKGLVIGLHRPGIAPNPATCGASGS